MVKIFLNMENFTDGSSAREVAAKITYVTHEHGAGCEWGSGFEEEEIRHVLICCENIMEKKTDLNETMADLTET